MFLSDLVNCIQNKEEIPLNKLENEAAKVLDYITYISPSIKDNFTSKKINKFNYSSNSVIYPLISCCILTKNEERSIQRCIGSIYDWVDEVLVIDTGSTDATLDIINNSFNGIRIIKKEWNQDFSEVRNFGLEAVQYQWVFFLDADEYVEPNEAHILKNIIALVDTISDCCYCLNPSILDHNGDKYIRTRRILNKKFNFRYKGRVHEELYSTQSNEVFDIGIALTIHHDGYKQEVFSNKKKAMRNSELIKLMQSEESHNPKWNYFYARSLLTEQNGRNEIEAEQQLLRVLEKESIDNEYIPRSLILLSQFYIKRADTVNLKKIITLIKEKKVAIPTVDLIYLEMALNLMVSIGKMTNIRKHAEEYIGSVNNSLINSRNDHLKNMTCLYCFYVGDFNKVGTFLNEKETSCPEDITDTIHSCLKLLNKMKNMLIQF